VTEEEQTASTNEYAEFQKEIWTMR